MTILYKKCSFQDVSHLHLYWYEFTIFMQFDMVNCYSCHCFANKMALLTFIPCLFDKNSITLHLKTIAILYI